MESAIDFVSIKVGSATLANVTVSFSSLAATRVVRWRAVSTEGMSSSGRNSDSSARARRYGSEAPIFATTRSVLWCAAVGHDLADRAQGLGASHSATAWLEPGRGNLYGTEQRHKTSGPLVLDGPRRLAPLASPPAAAMILRLCLNEMVLQSGERQLSLCRRQPDGPGRILVNPRAAADLVNADGPIRPGHLHHDPPLHPAPRSPTPADASTPRFWTVSIAIGRFRDRAGGSRQPRLNQSADPPEPGRRARPACAEHG